MNDNLKILFTGIGRRVELVQAFREAALVLNKKVLLYGADMGNTAPALYYCDFTKKVPPMRDKNYIDSLLDICKTEQINLVIPTIDTDLLVLSENRDRFEEINTKVLISAPDKIRICRDKNITSRFFVQCGLNAPMPVNDWEHYDSGFPAFIKPKDGSSSINAFKVENVEELKTYALNIGDYVIQPFVEGKEYTIDIFCDWHGNPLSVVPRERVQVRAGEVLKTRITLDSVMIEEAKALCKHFQPCGPMTVQLIRDANTGRDFFIEINPRFGGGAPLSMKAGAKSVELILKLLCNEPTEACKDIEDGAVYSRFDQSVRIAGDKAKISGVIFDLDDTLYPEEAYVRSGYRAVAKYLGNADLEKKLLEYFAEGKSAIDDMLKDLNKLELKEEVLNVYRTHRPEIELYRGAEKLIKALKDKGCKVGIITDGRPDGQRNKIEALSLEKLVDDIIITDELGGIQFRKPCDIAFRIMQLRWKLPANEIIYVGDNVRKDFQAPMQLGMQCFLVNNIKGLYFEEQTGNNLTAESIKPAFSVKDNAIDGENLLSNF